MLCMIKAQGRGNCPDAHKSSKSVFKRGRGTRPQPKQINTLNGQIWASERPSLCIDTRPGFFASWKGEGLEPVLSNALHMPCIIPACFRVLPCTREVPTDRPRQFCLGGEGRLFDHSE